MNLLQFSGAAPLCPSAKPMALRALAGLPHTPCDAASCMAGGAGHAVAMLARHQVVAPSAASRQPFLLLLLMAASLANLCGNAGTSSASATTRFLCCPQTPLAGVADLNKPLQGPSNCPFDAQKRFADPFQTHTTVVSQFLNQQLGSLLAIFIALTRMLHTSKVKSDGSVPVSNCISNRQSAHEIPGINRQALTNTGKLQSYIFSRSASGRVPAQVQGPPTQASGKHLPQDDSSL